MSNKQGQPNAGGSRKQEGETNNSQQKAKGELQQDQGGKGAGQPSGSQKQGTQPGSQKDRKGKIGQ